MQKKIVEILIFKEKNMEGIFENILGEDEIDTLFSEPESNPDSEEKGKTDKEKSEDIEKTDTDKTTEVVNPDDLFGDQETQPESVGSEKNKEDHEEKEDATTDKDSGSSPNENFYSSIANALAVDGIFPNLDDDDIKKVTDAESLSDAIEAEINARLDEKQKRISKALENGVEPTDIKKYEDTLQFISSITDAALAEESEKGEQLRRNLIYQDFLNKGYSPEKAQKFTERTIDAGTDLEDAKEALQSNKEFFQKKYNSLLKEAEDAANEERAERTKAAEKLKDSLLKEKQLFGDMEISTEVRKKAYENVMKPVYKDPETGEYMTALQKYQMENKADFLKYVGLFMALTDGFKDFKSFTKGEVKKEVKKGLRELEQTLNNTRRNADGSLKMVSSAKEDPESFIGGNFNLAL